MRNDFLIPRLFAEAVGMLDKLGDCDCGCQDGGLLRVSLDENEDGYTFKAEVPGLAKDNIDVQYKDKYLIIRAEWKQECKEEECTCLRAGKYSRAIYVPDIDATQINATLKDGVLTLKAPKRDEIKPKSVDIKVDA